MTSAVNGVRGCGGVLSVGNGTAGMVERGYEMEYADCCVTPSVLFRMESEKEKSSMEKRTQVCFDNSPIYTK